MRINLYFLIVLALCLINASAETPKASRYIEIHKSKPVEVNGLEFVAAIQAQWPLVSDIERSREEVQLWITNRSGHDLAFVPPGQLNLRNADGTAVPSTGMRDGTRCPLPIVIRVGDTCCLSIQMEMFWHYHERCFLTYTDDTGFEWTYEPLKPGHYSLSFSIDASEKDASMFSKLLGGMAVWSGSVTTKEAPFDIIEGG